MDTTITNSEITAARWGYFLGILLSLDFTSPHGANSIVNIEDWRSEARLKALVEIGLDGIREEVKKCGGYTPMSGISIGFAVAGLGSSRDCVADWPRLLGPNCELLKGPMEAYSWEDGWHAEIESLVSFDVLAGIFDSPG